MKVIIKNFYNWDHFSKWYGIKRENALYVIGIPPPHYCPRKNYEWKIYYKDHSLELVRLQTNKTFACGYIRPKYYKSLEDAARDLWNGPVGQNVRNIIQEEKNKRRAKVLFESAKKQLLQQFSRQLKQLEKDIKKEIEG